jgi:hypothetical protein
MANGERGGSGPRIVRRWMRPSPPHPARGSSAAIPRSASAARGVTEIFASAAGGPGDSLRPRPLVPARPAQSASARLRPRSLGQAAQAYARLEPRGQVHDMGIAHRLHGTACSRNCRFNDVHAGRLLHTHEGADLGSTTRVANAHVDTVTNQSRKKSPWKKLPSAVRRLQAFRCHHPLASCCVVATASVWIDRFAPIGSRQANGRPVGQVCQ